MFPQLLADHFVFVQSWSPGVLESWSPGVLESWSPLQPYTPGSEPVIKYWQRGLGLGLGLGVRTEKK